MKIIFVNPGKTEKNDWSDDVSLTEVAIAETTRLAQIIAQLIGNDSIIAIFASTEDSATESAIIFSTTLDVSYDDIGCFCPDNINDDIEKILELISEYDTDEHTIIFIISCPFLLKLLQQIIREYQNVDTDIDDIEQNHALFVDLDGGPPVLVGPNDDVY